MRKSVVGGIPYSDDAFAAVHRRRSNLLRVAAAAMTGAVPSLYLFDREVLDPLPGWLGLGSLLTLVAALYLRTNTPGSVGATIDDNPRWVVLEPVHPGFAAAYDQQRALPKSTGPDTPS
jgi:hypothetical protein